MMQGGQVAPDDVRKAEEFLKRRMPLRVTVNSKQVTDEGKAQVSEERVDTIVILRQ